MRKAYAYLRVSGKSQVEGDGFARQMKAIRNYICPEWVSVEQPYMLRYKLVRTFKEEGVSGTNDIANRPALVELLAALEADSSIEVVIIEKLDRLARDLMIQEAIMADFRKRGVTLISALEPDLCSDDPSRKLMRQIFGAFAEYEKTMLVAKLKGARQRKKAATGRCEGIKPYGHNEEEREVLRVMKLQRSEGQSYDNIASWLNGEKFRTRAGQGARWHGATVAKILARQEATQ